MATDPSPPDYTETHWRIYDAQTGEVLATEVIWTEEGADESATGPSRALLREFADADAVQAAGPAVGAERVDISTGRLAAVDADTVRPAMPEHP